MSTFSRPTATALLTLALGAAVFAQQRGQNTPPASARQQAQVDVTGYWVAQITEDWRWRMMTPPKGDILGVPLNDAGRKVAEAWDLAADTREGRLCKAFGAGGLLRHPLRIQITWVDDNTLELRTDLGQQTRRFHFDPAAARRTTRTLQGTSVASWTAPAPRGRGRGNAAPGPRAFGPGVAPPPAFVEPPTPRGGLRVVTTSLSAGYLRKNGIPYSENAVVRESFDRVQVFDQDYLNVVTEVVDPVYLTTSFIVSNHFKREPDGARWTPAPCAVDPPAVARGGRP